MYSDGYIEKVPQKGQGKCGFKIVIPSSQPENRKNFTIAHELGHLFLHMGYMINEELWDANCSQSFNRKGDSEIEWYMLSGRDEFSARMQIITYRSLKGVWGGKVYPIIWYYDKSKNENIEFIDSLPFDAIEQDDIYKEFFGDKPFRESMYQDNREALEKILYDRKLGYKIKMIENLIDSENGEMKSLLNESRLELHCVAVCFDKQGRVLIAKRNHRKILNGKWECGCAKANAQKELVDSIKEEECVTDLKNTLSLAFNQYHKWKEDIQG